MSELTDLDIEGVLQIAAMSDIPTMASVGRLLKDIHAPLERAFNKELQRLSAGQQSPAETAEQVLTALCVALGAFSGWALGSMLSTTDADDDQIRSFANQLIGAYSEVYINGVQFTLESPR